MGVFKALDMWTFKESYGYAVRGPEGPRVEVFEALCDKVNPQLPIDAANNNYNNLIKSGYEDYEPSLYEGVILHRASPVVQVPDEKRIMVSFLGNRTLWITDYEKINTYGCGEAKAVKNGDYVAPPNLLSEFKTFMVILTPLLIPIVAAAAPVAVSAVAGATGKK